MAVNGTDSEAFKTAIFSSMVQLRVKDILRERNMTVMELARRMGKSQPYVSNIINGKQGVSINTLQMVAKELDVPISSLFADYIQT